MNKKILVYPFFEKNPYQHIIIEELEKQEYEITKESPHYTHSQFHLIRLTKGYDILHLHWIGFCYSSKSCLWFILKTVLFCITLFIIRMNGVKIILTLHNLVPHDSKNYKLHLFARKLVMKCIDKVIVHSYPAMEIATKHLGSHKKFITILHVNYTKYYKNTINRGDARNILGLSQSKKIVLFFGALKPYKNIEKIMQYFKNNTNNDLLLVICGNGEIDYLDSLTGYHSENVRSFYKFVPDDEIQIFMRAADCLILPYSQSFTSAAAVLGIGYNLPLVCNDRVAFKHLFDRGLCFLFNIDDKKSIEDAIENALKCNRKELTVKYSAFLNECSPWFVANKHAEIYDE